METRAANQVTWTPSEAILWETARIVGDLRSGRPLTGRPGSFALSLGDGAAEHLLASVPYSRTWFGPAGDGTYRTSTTFVGGFSPVGILLGAATLGASAAGNARRRVQAANALENAWRPCDTGLLHVSDRGFYVETEGQIWAFRYGCIQRMDLVGPGAVQLTAEMADGTVSSYVVTSDGAEMLFAVWACFRCPDHPHFTGLVWLPQPFVARVRWAGLLDSLGGGQLRALSPIAASATPS